MSLQKLVLSSLCLIFSFTAKANLDPLSGARVSVGVTQKLMAAQPLPSLRSEKDIATLQASYILVTMSGKDDVNYDEYHGDFHGNTFGLGYSSTLKRDVGYYINAFYDTLDGEAQVQGAGSNIFTTKGGAITGGYSYRLIGKDDSKFVVGLFAGPALMYFSSTLTINETNYYSKPFVYGGQVGLQVRLRLNNNMTFTPYGIYMKEFSDKCKKVTSPAGPVSAGEGCPDSSQASPADASFSGMGAVLGYKRFQFNIYTEMFNDETYDDLDMWDLAVSYSF